VARRSQRNAGVDSSAARAAVTGEEALARLIEGNKRYADGQAQGPRRDSARRAEQAEGQTPFAVILTCADSRVPPEIVFDQGIGDLFVVRVAGNTANNDVTLGSIEFAVSVLHCPLVVVLGHEKCGAVTAALDAAVNGQRPGRHLAALIDPIRPAVQSGELDAAVEENVRLQVAHLATAFPAPQVAGAVYALASGRVDLVA
jgi:carbonic anhydrase